MYQGWNVGLNGIKNSSVAVERNGGHIEMLNSAAELFKPWKKMFSDNLQHPSVSLLAPF